MAAGDSIISICNTALTDLGEDIISALTDGTKRAILCSLRYDPVRRAVLRSHPWNCAKKQIQLPASATAPLFTWSYAYPLPPEFIRMFDEPDNDRPSWEILGNQLMTNDAPPFNAVIVYDLQDPTQFDPLLVDGLAKALAAELAPSLTRSETIENRAAARAEQKLSPARLAGSQENSPKEWDQDVWLRARQ